MHLFPSEIKSAWQVEVIKNVLPYVDMVKISDEEGVLPTGKDAWLKAAEKLLAQGPKLIAATLGGQGVYLASQAKHEQISAFQAQVVDTTGAGDSFWGGFLSKYMDYQMDMQSLPWENWRNCAKFGNAVAGLCVQKRGGIPSVPEKKEVVKILEEQ